MSEKRPAAPKSPLSRAANRTPATEHSQQHPFNPNSQIHGHSLARPSRVEVVVSRPGELARAGR